MFQVPMDTAQIPWAIDEQVGVLAWNGHAAPHVEPLMSAFLKEQAAQWGRRFEFWNLDRLASYVVDRQLSTTLREALRELARDALGQ